RVIEGIFDNYWVSSGTTLPWMIAGLALGAWDAHLSRSQIVLPRETPYLPHHMATMVRLPHGLSRPAGPDD
ncbi:MAG TPA: hypothetical protein VK425_06770, partial [Acidimicrobiales bacterium]|nr:hypothetical protein [Acidimicrobiales bacterium]